MLGLLLFVLACLLLAGMCAFKSDKQAVLMLSVAFLGTMALVILWYAIKPAI